MKSYKLILTLAASLLLGLNSLMADDGPDGAAVTVSASSANPNPVCVGSLVSVTFTATPTGPANAQKELKITGTNYSWAASDGTGWTTNQPNGSATWDPGWKPSACGSKTLTASVTVTFSGTQQTGTPNESSYTTTVSSGNASATVTVISISLSMNDAQRIGISANGHDRTQHIIVTACPSSEIVNVALTHGPHITLSNFHMNVGDGTKTFDLVGTDKSGDPEDTYVTATDNASGCSVTKTATVIVPAAIGTPHPQFDEVVESKNYVLDSNSVPPSYGLPPSYVSLITAAMTPVSIPVVDQFTDPCGDLYDGSEIKEDDKKMNVNLSGSSYIDNCAWRERFGDFRSNSSEAIGWPTHSVFSISNGSKTRTLEIKVDGFLLNPSIVDRKISYTSVNGHSGRLKIEWPD